MAQQVAAPPSNPTDVVRLTLDALEAGEEEVLADEASRMVKQGLSSGGYLGARSA
ncbi:short-chain dehydrogenase [Corallococcus macrosporus]|uniref:Short-chain dehydrogenase n=1 Tax=Corallococcus macrosporus DSM 14697 TaxID=1189310 RepID=A0A250K4C7_9BACT|nr:short-chain dehydrogenase [Corallococcus macrosporus]ATB50838.1 short-chain dehydrogenase [Corallococcus macrosporus DSM 14697]